MRTSQCHAVARYIKIISRGLELDSMRMFEFCEFIVYGQEYVGKYGIINLHLQMRMSIDARCCVYRAAGHLRDDQRIQM
jgi:hypothetical protein